MTAFICCTKKIIFILGMKSLQVTDIFGRRGSVPIKFPQLE
jgi:hypothetical protein